MNLASWLKRSAVAIVSGCAAAGSGDVPPDRTSHASGGSKVSDHSEPGGPASNEPGHTPAPVFGPEGAPLRQSGTERCQKVDFLYVVDNSPSMVNKQITLARSFMGFSRILEETLGAIDRTVMVIDTDDFNPLGVFQAEDAPPEAEDACAKVLGAGLRASPRGESCGIVGEQRYMRDDQPHLASTFECLAKVGTHGSVKERPVEALLAATGARGGEAAACNSGFPRDDALLVVTLIADEDDVDSNGEPDGWKRRLVEVKRGREEGVVMLGLIADNHVPGGLPGGPCDGLNGAPSPRLSSFVEEFALGSLGSVCSPDYSAFFAEAVAAVDTACEAFVPDVH